MFSILRAEALAAGTGRRGVGIFHLEPAVQRIEVIQFAAGDVERALGVHHHAHAAGFDQDVAIGRAVLQIHLVLQTGATAADDRHAQHAVGPALLGQQRRDLLRRAGRELDQPLVADAEIRLDVTGFVRFVQSFVVAQVSCRRRQRQRIGFLGSGTFWSARLLTSRLARTLASPKVAKRTSTGFLILFLIIILIFLEIRIKGRIAIKRNGKFVFIRVHPWFIFPRVKLISWNVNGLRAVLKKNFLDYLDAEKPDVLCLQETKCSPNDVEQLWPASYTTYWNSAEKKGYSGTAIFTKTRPLKVIPHIDIAEHDQEGRVLAAEFADFFLVNVYVPNAKRDLSRLTYRQKWDRDFLSLSEKAGEEEAGDFLRRPQRGAHGD